MKTTHTSADTRGGRIRQERRSSPVVEVVLCETLRRMIAPFSGHPRMCITRLHAYGCRSGTQTRIRSNRVAHTTNNGCMRVDTRPTTIRTGTDRVLLADDMTEEINVIRGGKKQQTHFQKGAM